MVVLRLQDEYGNKHVVVKDKVSRDEIRIIETYMQEKQGFFQEFQITDEGQGGVDQMHFVQSDSKSARIIREVFGGSDYYQSGNETQYPIWDLLFTHIHDCQNTD